MIYSNGRDTSGFAGYGFSIDDGYGFSIDDFLKVWPTVSGGSVFDFYKAKSAKDLAMKYGYDPSRVPIQPFTASIDKYVPLLMIGMVGIVAISLLKR